MADVPNAQLDAAQNAILAAGTTYYLGFCTGDPGKTGANEGNAGRQAITFAASSAGTQASNSAQTFTGVAGGQTFTNFGIWTAATAGTFLRGGALTASITPPAGSNVTVASGAITFTAA